MTSTSEIEEAMSGVKNIQDIGEAIKNLGKEKPSGSEKPPAEAGKEEPPDTTPVPSEGLSAEEISLFKPAAKTGPKEPGEEQPTTIAGTPYQTQEALADGYKNLQRQLQQVKDAMKSTHNQQLQQEVKAEINRMLGEIPPPQPQESEEEKALKKDDPEAYEVVQLKKQIASQSEQMKELLGAINSIKQHGQVQEIQSQFRALAKEKEVPFDILMAYASIPQYANVPAELVADEVKTLWDNEVKKAGGGQKPKPGAAPAPGSIRSPSSGGSTGLVTAPLTVDDIGVPGSKKFREFTQKKMAQIFRQRFAGGGAD